MLNNLAIRIFRQVLRWPISTVIIPAIPMLREDEVVGDDGDVKTTIIPVVAPMKMKTMVVETMVMHPTTL